jgi:hypothetical protein
MEEPEFRIAYPVFALKRGGEYIGYDLRRSRPKRDGFALPVFTTEEKATAFIRPIRVPTEIKRLDRIEAFRRVLELFRPPGTDHVVWFDPAWGPAWRIDFPRGYPVGVVIEYLLPEPTSSWVYPVYVLRGRDCYGYVPGARDGKPVNMLAVFTDADLADRAVTAGPPGGVAVSVADSDAFVKLVRGLPPYIGAVVFDPPIRNRPGPARAAVSRESLLADLEFRL